MSVLTLAEMFRLLGTADGSLAQIPQSHFAHVNVIRRQGSEEQRKFFFAELLAGRRFGNSQSEAGTRHVQDILPFPPRGVSIRGRAVRVGGEGHRSTAMPGTAPRRPT